MRRQSASGVHVVPVAGDTLKHAPSMRQRSIAQIAPAAVHAVERDEHGRRRRRFGRTVEQLDVRDELRIERADFSV